MSTVAIGTDVNQACPKTLDHIIAQPLLQENLKIFVSAYWNERAVGRISGLPPILLSSAPSGGKTTVGLCLHNELANTRLVETIGESLNNLAELYDICLQADDDTTIFVDECQGVGASAAHVWLKILSEGILCLPKGKCARNYSIPMPKGTTYIFATTHEFCLSSALRSRFKVFRFDEYTEDGLFEILKQRSVSLRWEIESEECLRYIAQRSKFMPRLALSNLQASYNVCRSDNREVITLDDVIKSFRLSQTDNELGLDALDMKYLRILSESSPAQLNVIASKIGLPARTIQEVVEPYLLKQGLFDKINSNRVITDTGNIYIENNE